MKEFNSGLSNQLEFTIHGLQDFDISRSPSPLPRVEDDIPSAILTPSDSDFDHQTELRPRNVTRIQHKIKNNLNLMDDDKPKSQRELVQMKENLAQREILEENILLQDLKAMKEEAWAKKKAHRLRKHLKKVQFQDESQKSQAAPFCRSCCASKKLSFMFGVGARVVNEVPKGEDASSESGESSGSSCKSTRTGQNKTKTKGNRPEAHLHSINMFQNIIPRYIFQQSGLNIFKPISKMLKEA